MASDPRAYFSPAAPPRNDRFRDEELIAIFRQWKARTFSSGAIDASGCEGATATLVEALYRPEWQRQLVGDPCRTVTKKPGEDWWDGLKALATVLGRRFSHGIGLYLKGEKKLDVSTWQRAFTANARSAVGRGGSDYPIPAEWTEDQVFIHAWGEAIATVNGETKYAAMYILAMYWDSFPLPLRYYSDSAARAVVNLALANDPHSLHSPLGPDQYRKDVRGPRGGLGLKPPANGKAVVTWSERDPNVLKVHRGMAKGSHLDLRNFPPPGWAADKGVSLHFVIV